MLLWRTFADNWIMSLYLPEKAADHGIKSLFACHPGKTYRFISYKYINNSWPLLSNLISLLKTTNRVYIFFNFWWKSFLYKHFLLIKTCFLKNSHGVKNTYTRDLQLVDSLHFKILIISVLYYYSSNWASEKFKIACILLKNSNVFSKYQNYYANIQENPFIS